MTRSLFAAGLIGLLGAAPARADDVTYVSLTAKANQKLDASFHNSTEGNNLPVPKGEQTLAGVKFKVEDGVIQLGGTTLADLPVKAEGVKVNAKATKLHFLHGTGNGGFGREGDEQFVADGTKIGEYTVHYGDRTSVTVPVVYGEDVRDWWNWDGSKKVARGKVGWEGANAMSGQNNVKLRVYVTTWENPKPDQTITHIDYASTKTVCAPFCVAITAEGPKANKAP